MKNFKHTLLAVSILLTSNALSVGIDSSSLAIPCTGQVKLTKINSIDVTRGFIDRAGKHHAPKGYADLEVVITSLSPGCSTMENKLHIDFESHQFEETYYFEETDREKISALAQEKIGQVHQFEAKQNFLYKNKSGYLPFFPLIHSETVTLESNTINLDNKYYHVDEKLVYNIYLDENEKVQLFQLAFEYLESGLDHGVPLTSLITVMTDNHPQLNSNFSEFLIRVLAFYKKYEEATDIDKKFDVNNWMLSTIASSIRDLTHKTPQMYAFKIPELLSDHPSLHCLRR